MCVIMMYKLSVGHTKIFYDFFASTADFRQNSAKFSTKLAGIRWPNFQKNWLNYRQIRLIIRLIRPNFIVLKFSCSLRMSTAFQPNFLGFQRFFLNFSKCDGIGGRRFFTVRRIL
jgi:hypothetical protein